MLACKGARIEAKVHGFSFYFELINDTLPIVGRSSQRPRVREYADTWRRKPRLLLRPSTIWRSRICPDWLMANTK